MSYINSAFNHFRAIQRWAAQTGARATLDATTFQLEVKHRNRYFILLPQFVASTEGRLSYVPTLTEGAFGFAGWLPYRPYSLEITTDKLLFKKFCADAGLATPATWASAADAERSFVLKRSRGSFGVQIAGPYGLHERATANAGAAGTGAGELFAEEFVAGSILKVWFWGSRAFFAHVDTYLSCKGDGIRRIDDLAQERMRVPADKWSDSADAAIAAACVAYQGRDLAEVLPAGAEVWIDFRYGRALGAAPTTPRSDNALDALATTTKEQIAHAGTQAGALLRERLPAPVAFTLDGVVDAAGNVWWLEMNSNPLFPPEGYAEMFSDLFA